MNGTLVLLKNWIIGNNKKNSASCLMTYSRSANPASPKVLVAFKISSHNPLHSRRTSNACLTLHSSRTSAGVTGTCATLRPTVPSPHYFSSQSPLSTVCLHRLPYRNHATRSLQDILYGFPRPLSISVTQSSLPNIVFIRLFTRNSNTIVNTTQ